MQNFKVQKGTLLCLDFRTHSQFPLGSLRGNDRKFALSKLPYLYHRTIRTPFTTRQYFQNHLLLHLRHLQSVTLPKFNAKDTLDDEDSASTPLPPMLLVRNKRHLKKDLETTQQKLEACTIHISIIHFS